MQASDGDRHPCTTGGARLDKLTELARVRNRDPGTAR